MTRAEYEAMMEWVLRDAERIGANGREVVLVMSRNIYRIISSYEQDKTFKLFEYRATYLWHLSRYANRSYR